MGGSVPEEKISWGWAVRIWWGVVWRWVLADAVITVTLAFLAVIVSRITGDPWWRNPPQIATVLVILWTVLLGWALAVTLRARHGGYRIALIRAEDQADAFD